MKRVLALLVASLGFAALSMTPATSNPLTDIPARLGAPIPSLPTDLLVPKYIGAPAVARPIASAAVPQNPWLAANGRSSMHNDSYSTNAYAVSGPLGKSPVVTSRSYGVRECATATFDRQGRLVALCGALEGFTMMLINPSTLAVVAQLSMPARDLTTLSNPFTDLCGGSYFFLTNDDRAIALTTTNEVWEVSTVGTSLVKTNAWQLAAHVADGDCLVALTADWSGRVWFLTKGGRIGTLDRATGAVQTLQLPSGEAIVNSVSGDETGGVYAVSTHALYRFDATASGGPAVTWRESYDRGTRTKPGQLSQGSGTSPALIGKRWIAITDNADPQMHVLVLDRRKSVSSRLHCSVPVFGDGTGDTENSLTDAGSSVLVENNYGYEGVQSTLFGKTTIPGFARVLIRPDGCRLAWTNTTASAPTSVPKASLGNGLIYAYTKPARSDGIDAWYFTAIDIRTGKVRWSRLTGTGIQWNNHYSSIYLGPDGTAYVATLAGLVRIADRP